MLKSVFRICVVGLLALGVVALVRPEIADRATDQVLGMFAQTSARLPAATDSISAAVSSATSAIGSRLFSKVASNNATPVTTLPDTVPFSPSDIVDATNKERVKAGLAPLQVNTKLMASAKLKTDDMITKQYFEHVSPTGQSVSDLGTKVGYQYILMGENLALGDFVSSDDLLQAWMNSPGHRANILNPSYHEIGAYAAKGTYEGKTVWFAVQHFGTSRTVCPSTDKNLKAQIDAMNLDLKSREAVIATAKNALEAPDHPTGQAYQTMVDHFNAEVAEYNRILTNSQQLIAKYNTGVKAFNTCLGKYQKK